MMKNNSGIMAICVGLMLTLSPLATIRVAAQSSVTVPIDRTVLPNVRLVASQVLLVREVILQPLSQTSHRATEAACLDPVSACIFWTSDFL